MRRAFALSPAKSDEWATPDTIKKQLYEEFGLEFDVCPIDGNTNALFEEWRGRVFVNPPYSDIYTWIDKALLEIRSGRCSVAVFLLPARTGSAWFHELAPLASQVRFLRGRLRFGGTKVNAPFDSLILVFDRGRTK